MTIAPTPSEEQALETALVELTQRRRALSFSVTLSGACWVTALITLFGLIGLMAQPVFLLIPLSLLVLGVVFLPRDNGHAVEKLLILKDVRAIGPLLETVGVAGGRFRRAIVAGLTELLPLLRPTDADLLNTVQRKALLEALLYKDLPRETDYVVAVLKAISAVGDQQALTVVQRLAQGIGDAPYERPIRKAVTDCITVLTARVAQQQIGGTLLRASARPDSPAELLRPASETQQIDAQQLLRADESGPI